MSICSLLVSQQVVFRLLPVRFLCCLCPLSPCFGCMFHAHPQVLWCICAVSAACWFQHAPCLMTANSRLAVDIMGSAPQHHAMPWSSMEICFNPSCQMVMPACHGAASDAISNISQAVSFERQHASRTMSCDHTNSLLSWSQWRHGLQFLRLLASRVDLQ